MNRALGARVEGVVLVVILTVVGLAAGAASFTHVHDWTMANSLQGTPGWFGWANAVISELVPVAALLTIRQRRRVGAPITYPLALLIASAALSLAAQLAVAKPGFSGGLLSAVPALAFMALAKLVFATPTGTAAPDAPASVEPASTLPRITPAAADVDPAPAAPPGAVDQPATPPSAPAAPRRGGVLPVPASAFTRVNGAPVRVAEEVRR
ncbi:MAG TPA: DUF2637 domain-containing protein [Pilimelia sp.]|nr:DUF2637 domain-containing protein [Pilimelia sp.]